VNLVWAQGSAVGMFLSPLYVGHTVCIECSFSQCKRLEAYHSYPYTSECKDVWCGSIYTDI